MIPTSILLGLAAGGWFGHRQPKPLLVMAVATSVLWGVVVGVGSSDAVVFIGGAALAFANYAVGALFGVGIRAVVVAAGLLAMHQFLSPAHEVETSPGEPMV